MQSKHYTQFKIDTCTHAGCVNYEAKGCWLNKLEIDSYLEQAEYLHNPKICVARRQADLFKTERLLYDE
jgi:hypothetical protein